MPRAYYGSLPNMPCRIQTCSAAAELGDLGGLNARPVRGTVSGISLYCQYALLVETISQTIWYGY
jgi:hypothetical protein